MDNKLKISLGILSIMLLAVITGCVNNPNEPQSVSLTDVDTVTTTQTPQTDDTLEIGVAAMISPKNTLNTYQDLVNYIGVKMGKKTKMVQRATYDEMNQLVENKEVVAAFVCAGPYVDGHEKFGMELLAVPQMYGETVYYSYIIVPADSTVTKFEQLKGKKFAFTDPKSNTGKLVPTYEVGKLNETPDTFFKEYIFTGSHDNSIESVSKKLVDGAAVDHLIYEFIKKTNPNFTSGTKVIAKLGPFAMPPVVTHPGTDAALKQQIKSILLNMDKDPEGKKILDQIAIEKFTTIDDSAYASVRKMSEWEKASKV